MFLRISGIQPVASLSIWLLGTLVGALIVRIRGIAAPARTRDRLWQEHVTRSTARLVAILGVLKGPFAKAGQFASVRHDLLPRAAAETLASLRDRVPPLALDDLRSTVERELGQPLGRLFAWIDPTPIGAASIAQAHRARLHGGGEVVVKIQYPWIEAALETDLRLLRLLGRALVRWSGRRPDDVDYDRLFDEFSRGLALELDFVQEARTAAEIAGNLRDVAGVVVPDVYSDLSSRRVLTMGFRPCVGIDDHAALAALGVRTDAVVEILARAYAKQVFVDGLFHADPHPGNLFVLATPEASERPQVLFVDFGLSRRLSPELRRAMRAGILAVLQRDLDGFVACMDEMGMIAPGAEPDVRAAVASMFERLADTRGGAGGGLLAASTGSVLSLKDEAKRLLQTTSGLQLPNDLLLYARTLSYLFALGESLDPDVDLMKISIPYLLRFLTAQD